MDVIERPRAIGHRMTRADKSSISGSYAIVARIGAPAVRPPSSAGLPPRKERNMRVHRTINRRKATVRLVAAFLAGLAPTVLVPSRVAAAPPPTLSRYMETASLQAHYDIGCDRAKRKVAGPIALIYGRPAVVNGAPGASIYSGPDATVQQIAAAARQFVQGYRDCSVSAPQIILIIATTNDESSPERVTFAHGAAWADLVDGVASWTADRGYGSLVNVQGGSDIEPGFNSVADTRAWVDGYDSANSRLLYTLPSADG